jgi:hypothetical protein
MQVTRNAYIPQLLAMNGGHPSRVNGAEQQFQFGAFMWHEPVKLQNTLRIPYSAPRLLR